MLCVLAMMAMMMAMVRKKGARAVARGLPFQKDVVDQESCHAVRFVMCVDVRVLRALCVRACVDRDIHRLNRWPR